MMCWSGAPWGNLEMESKLWHAMDACHDGLCQQAQLVALLEEPDAVTTDSNDTKVSLYSRGAMGLVMILSNLGKDAREVQARLNLQALQLGGALTALDIITEEESAVPADGVITQELDPLEFCVLWIRPAGSN